MDLLVKHGRVLAVKDEMWADGILFDNLGFGNVGVNRVAGNYAVVDCLISKWSEKNVRDLWGRNRFVVNEFTMQMEVTDFLNRDFGKYQLHFELSGLKHFIKFRRLLPKVAM